MEEEEGGEADLSSGSAAPRWKRRSTPRPQPRGGSKPRPQSYQSPNGVLFTDFPVEDRCTFTVTQPAGTVSACPGSAALRRGASLFSSSMGSVSNGKVRPPASPEPSSQRCPPALPLVSNGSLGFAANGAVTSPGSQPGRAARVPGPTAVPAQRERVAFPAGPGPAPPPADAPPPGGGGGAAALPPHRSRPAKTPEKASPASPGASPEPGGAPQGPPSPAEQPVVLSTNSPAALKVGTQQIIPKSLASEIKASGKATGQNAESRRVLKVRSMVESPSLPLVADGEEEAEGELDSPGTLRRGLRSTSYRRAVVSGVDFDGSANFKKKNRMSQPILKAVVEDKEKFSSLGRMRVSCAAR